MTLAGRSASKPKAPSTASTLTSGIHPHSVSQLAPVVVIRLTELTYNELSTAGTACYSIFIVPSDKARKGVFTSTVNRSLASSIRLAAVTEKGSMTAHKSSSYDLPDLLSQSLMTEVLTNQPCSAVPRALRYKRGDCCFSFRFWINFNHVILLEAYVLEACRVSSIAACVSGALYIIISSPGLVSAHQLTERREVKHCRLPVEKYDATVISCIQKTLLLVEEMHVPGSCWKKAVVGCSLTYELAKTPLFRIPFTLPVQNFQQPTNWLRTRLIRLDGLS